MRGIRIALAAALAGSWIAGCGSSEPPRRVEPVRVEEPTPVPTPSYFVHEIEFRGQTLGRIARWYTGDFENWKKLVRPVNPDLTVCCAPLRVGRRVQIPKELVVRTDPMPRPVTRAAPPLRRREPEPTEAPAAAEPPKAPTPAPAEAAEDDESLEIIGPR